LVSSSFPDLIHCYASRCFPKYFTRSIDPEEWFHRSRFDSYCYYIAPFPKEYCYQIDRSSRTFGFKVSSSFPDLIHITSRRFPKYCYQIDRSRILLVSTRSRFDSYYCTCVSQSIATRSIDPVGILVNSFRI
jgi:hypothetical protein